VGKWRLVRAGGLTPAEFSINSQVLVIAADGTWTSKGEGGLCSFLRTETLKTF
jgi:hypothetical protein